MEMDHPNTSSEASETTPNVTFNMFEFPIIMQQSLSVGHEIYPTSVVAVGMFLDCFVLFDVVSFSRQLRYPRHIFCWAAISLFECFFLVEVALDM